MIHSKIERVGGTPMLVVNGETVIPMAYITYFQEKNCYKEFAQKGYNLFSVQMMFATRSVNEESGLPPFQEGIYEKDEPDYSIIDRNFRRILDVCPDAYIFPRVNVNLPRKWERDHSDELCFGKYSDYRCACFASDEWAGEVKRLLKDFIAYIETKDYCDRIVGYQISGGNTEEWFPLGPDGGDGKRAREAFSIYREKNHIILNNEEVSWFETEIHDEDGVKNTPKAYKRFLSELMAQRVIEFTNAAKEMTQNRLAVGSFYGYTFSCYDWQSCHHALKKILESDSVDFLCSPMDYSELRKPGFDVCNMLPLDSLKLHNKLYFAENDTRTHLTKGPNDLPRYNSPLFLGPEKSIALEVIKMHFSRALTHGHAMWWFDMWGGWYNDDDYLRLMGRCHSIYEASMTKDRRSSAEVAVIIDENVWSECVSDDWYVPADAKPTLGLTGAPYDIYLASDFEKIYKSYKAIVFVIPAKTELINKCINTAKQNNVAYYEFTHRCVQLDENNHWIVNPEDLVSFYKKSGVHVYTNLPAVVYASDSYVFLHTAKQGIYDFGFDGKKNFKDLFTGENYTFPCEMEFGKSYLFEK